MKIIVSPTKTMKVCNRKGYNEPMFLTEAKKLHNWLKSLDTVELRKIFTNNPKILEENINRLNSGFTTHYMAIYAYDGLQFKNMNTEEFTNEDLEYLDQYLRIISGLYGVLKPTDSIIHYRLEMKVVNAYWTKIITDYFKDEVILNLASLEYSQVIKNKNMINVYFYKRKNDGKLVQIATEAKMLRGRLVNYCVKNRVQEIKEIFNFSDLGYSFNEELSTNNKIVYIKEAESWES